jgi:hypothetical protein
VAQQVDEEPVRVDLAPGEAALDRPEAPARVVLLPGARYSTQAPLLWFAREVALAHGCGVLALEGVAPTTGDRFAWARERAERALDFGADGRRRVVIGKSLASAAAGVVGARGVSAIWLTPLLHIEAVLEGLAQVGAPTMLVGGTADESWKPAALPRSSAFDVVELGGADHSLQIPGDPRASLDALAQVVAAIERFLETTLS